MEGRVEVCRSGVWGAVYDYGGWNYNDVKVICRQLGYPSECEFYVPACHVYTYFANKSLLTRMRIILVTLFVQIKHMQID